MIPGLIQPGQIFSPGATLNFSLPTTPSTSRTRPRARAAADIKPDLFGKHALIGAKVEAERVALAAARDVLLTAAANTAAVQGKSSGSSFGGGVTFSFGGTQNGLSFQLNASRMQGKKNGHETVWDNTSLAPPNRSASPAAGTRRSAAPKWPASASSSTSAANSSSKAYKTSPATKTSSAVPASPSRSASRRSAPAPR